MAVIQAQDIVNAVIQDFSSQTTNRTALYDYTDRIHQRILRESRWRFLLSDPQTFATMPGVSAYTLVSGTPPAGSFQTNLMLSNFKCLDPESVFNLSTWTPLLEDTDDRTSTSAVIYRDGSLRYGQPRTYLNSLSSPGTIELKPVPDNQNIYYPVPETPVASSVTAAGCTLPLRLYYGVVTFVDSTGNEGTACVIPLTVMVPQGSVLTVESPNPVPGGGISGNQAAYSQWNLYVGFSPGNYFLQNLTPMPLGTNWTEPVTGIFQGVYTIPSTLNIAGNDELTIDHDGTLGTTYVANLAVRPWALIDPNGGWWEVLADPTTHLLETQAITPNTSGVDGLTVAYINDQEGISTWALTVDASGILQASIFATPPSSTYFNQNPPTTSQLQPLYAYIIQFRYYQARNQIVNPTDVLQIPYEYKDIVIDGVSYLTALYLDKLANVQPSVRTLAYKKDFDAGLMQIRRDLRINYKQADFISPDQVTQATVGNQQGIPTMGW